MRVKRNIKTSIYESNIKRRTSKFIASFAGGVLIVATIGLAACTAGPYTEATGLPNKLLTPGGDESTSHASKYSQQCLRKWLD